MYANKEDKNHMIVVQPYYYWKGQQDAVNEFFKGTKYENRIQRFQTQGSHIGYLFKNP